MTSSIQDEPLLTIKDTPLIAYPITNPETVDFFNRAIRSVWLVEDIDLSTDVQHWRSKCGEGMRHFLTKILAFFAASDVIVNRNLETNFSLEVEDFYCKAFYAAQALSEVVHTQTYTLLITTLVEDEEERYALLNSVITDPFVAKKAAWANKYMNRDTASIYDRLVAFACVEGIFFSASFCAIYWVKQQGLMPGLCASNEYIARDENLHATFACHLHKRLVGKCSRIEQIVREAVELEEEYVRDCLQTPLIGMNATSMCEYVRFCADRLLRDLDHEPVFKVTNPFEWMTLMSLTTKDDFFSRRPTAYKLNAGGLVKREKVEIEAFDL